MANFKNIKIKMKGGGSRLQRVKVLASGKYKFVKNLTKSKSKSKSSNPSPMKKARKVYKKLTKKKRRIRSMTIPLAPIIGIVATPAFRDGINGIVTGNYDGAIKSFGRFIGVDWDGKFKLDILVANMGPVVAGLLVHKFVGGAPLNLNRTLGAAKVPFIRI